MESGFAKKWLEEGRQIGKNFSFKRGKLIYWSSVGVQKWNGIYKVYVDEIEEEKMAAEIYSKEIIAQFDTLEKIEPFLKLNSETKLSELTPLKSQKIFNPEFNF